MSFYLLTLSITLIVTLFVAWLLMRRVPETADPQHLRIARNVALYRQRLAKLDDELAGELLDQDEYDELKTELARQLLHDVDRLQQMPARVGRHRRWYALLIVTPLLALLMYQSLGGWPDWQISRQLQALQSVADEASYRSQLAAIVDRIRQRLEQRPDHVEYRLLLASEAMGRDDFATAATHYGILAELLPEDDEVLALYAQAEYLRGGRQINATVAQYMDRSLVINPQNRTVLGLMGVHAMQQGDYAAAAAAWRRLLAALPPGSQQAALIANALAAAEQKLPDAGRESASLAALQVDVSVAAAVPLRDGTLQVYVYARAAEGPPMPLAVKRLTLADLPATVILDDAAAMMAGMTLSAFDDVVVGARISISGEARAGAGDWQAETQLPRWREHNGPVVLEIAEPL